jgi:hypothetical protein
MQMLAEESSRQKAVGRRQQKIIDPLVDGKFVDNDIVTANKINSVAILVPVKVLGTHDGQWQPMAWKTDALYGNPLKGFTAP